MACRGSGVQIPSAPFNFSFDSNRFGWFSQIQWSNWYRSIVDDIAKFRNSSPNGIILVTLPGLGSFPAGFKELKERGLVNTLIERNKNQKPIMGICLGMQLLF